MIHTNSQNWIRGVMVTLLFVNLAVVGCGNSSTTAEASDDTTTTLQNEETPEIAETVDENAARLKGKLTGNAIGNDLIVLSQLLNGNLKFVDSTRTDSKGNYSFAHNAESPLFFYVTINSTQPPGVPVILENSKSVTLNLEIGEYIETEVKGDDNNKQLKKLYDLYLGHNKASVNFQKKYSQVNPTTLTDSAKRAINAEYAAIQGQMNKDVDQYVQTQPGGPATYFAAVYVLPEASPTILDNALAKLKQDAPNSAYTKKLEAQINSKKALEIGGLAPDIELKSPTGELVKLSSLRGNVVLIDFWASWCRPCRAENPNVVRVYNKYKEKGFEVFGVSLDRDAGRWQGAIQQDGLTWTHVSDLRGWKSSAAALYKVSSIPQTFLLDKNGRIIGKNLRGHALEAKLQEIFN